MENNRFFKFLWRANAIFLFAAGLVLIGILLMMAAFLISDFGGSDTPPPTASSNSEKAEDKEFFRLTTPSKYKRQTAEGYAYFELHSGSDSWSKLGSNESSQLRNIGVFDLNTDKIHWVFPDAQQEIEVFLSVTKSVKDETEKDKSVTTGFLLTVAKSLPNGTIARDLWVMTPEGKNLKKILTDISRGPEVENFGDGQIKLVVATKSVIDVYPFDVDTLTLGNPTKVTIP